MKRNAYIIQSNGKRDDLTPDFKRPYSPDTILFLDAIERITAQRGAVLITSATATIDALMIVRQTVEIDLVARAKSLLEDL